MLEAETTGMVQKLRASGQNSRYKALDCEESEGSGLGRSWCNCIDAIEMRALRLRLPQLSGH